MPRRRLLSTTEWTWEWEPHSSSPLCRLYRDMIASMFAKEIGRQRKQIQSHLARLSSSSFILQCFDRRDSKLCRELPVPVRSVLFARSFPMECVSIHINSNALGFLHRLLHGSDAVRRNTPLSCSRSLVRKGNIQGLRPMYAVALGMNTNFVSCFSRPGVGTNPARPCSTRLSLRREFEPVTNIQDLPTGMYSPV